MKRTLKFGAQSLLTLIRILVILVLIFVVYSLYKIFFTKLIDEDDMFFIPLIILWALTAYILLPRIHRFFTKIYLPNYFIGRTRTGDGFFGDPVNIAFLGTKKQLVTAMKQAGWVQAEELHFKSSIKMVKASLLKRSYPNAPVSSLYLFSRKQDITFQQEINGNPHARHHIRFWKTPSAWWLPGGHKADWLASATYDKRVGLSLFTLQITHKIDADTDAERDYVIDTLLYTKRVRDVVTVEHFSTAYHSRNGGGDKIKTDGALPFVHFK